MKTFLILIGVLLILGTVATFGYQQWNIDTPVPLDPDSENSQTDALDVNSDLYSDWIWNSSIDASDKTMTPKDPNRFVLTLGADGRLSSTTDCNSIAGSFVINEEVISVGPLMSTLMACEGETLESLYASQLALASSYTITDNVLTLQLVKDAGTMTFYQK